MERRDHRWGRNEITDTAKIPGKQEVMKFKTQEQEEGQPSTKMGTRRGGLTCCRKECSRQLD